MALVAAALVPHSPTLLPGLAQSARARVRKTLSAIKELANRMADIKVDVLFLVAAQTETTAVAHRYALLQASSLGYSFTELGDLTTSGNRIMATGFIHHLKERCETSLPIPLVSPAVLPYTFAVPLVCLGEQMNNVPIVCLQLPRELPLDELNKLADFLREELQVAAGRVAWLSLGTLARHTIGVGPEAKVYDQSFQTALLNPEHNALINLDARLRARVQDSLWGPAALLSCVVSERTFKVEVNSYEVPLAVGLLVAEYQFG